jgi:hypothetical protein
LDYDDHPQMATAFQRMKDAVDARHTHQDYVEEHIAKIDNDTEKQRLNENSHVLAEKMHTAMKFTSRDEDTTVRGRLTGLRYGSAIPDRQKYRGTFRGNSAWRGAADVIGRGAPGRWQQKAQQQQLLQRQEAMASIKHRRRPVPSTPQTPPSSDDASTEDK